MHLDDVYCFSANLECISRKTHSEATNTPLTNVAEAARKIGQAVEVHIKSKWRLRYRYLSTFSTPDKW